MPVANPEVAGSSPPSADEVLFCEPTLSARWPAELSELVVRCLAVEPSARPDATAIHEALDACEHAMRTED